MALAAFGAHEFAGTGQAKSLGCRFVGLQLDFASSFALRGIADLLLSDKIKPRDLRADPRTSTSLGFALRLGLRFVSTSSTPAFSVLGWWPQAVRPFPSFLAARLCWEPTPRASCDLPFAEALQHGYIGQAPAAISFKSSSAISG